MNLSPLLTYPFTPSSPLSNLFDNHKSCTPTGQYQNDCSHLWEFSWTDIGAVAPASLQIPFVLQISCVESGPQSVSPNDTTISTFNNVVSCGSCSVMSSITLTPTSLSSYVTVRTNTFTVQAPSCEGINNQGGTLVTVTH